MKNVHRFQSRICWMNKKKTCCNIEITLSDQMTIKISKLVLLLLSIWKYGMFVYGWFPLFCMLTIQSNGNSWYGVLWEFPFNHKMISQFSWPIKRNSVGLLSFVKISEFWLSSSKKKRSTTREFWEMVNLGLMAVYLIRRAPFVL